MTETREGWERKTSCLQAGSKCSPGCRHCPGAARGMREAIETESWPRADLSCCRVTRAAPPDKVALAATTPHANIVVWELQPILF
ncbi:hypothetical protein J6590_004269 [Homalodisca vitripennis]|nr:hypothetical protein J6590_004269 [Homalodisca vitripennis]